jgi:large subunit ribosomal protein L30
MGSNGKLRIRWVKSTIGAKKEHKATLRALGLHRLNQEVVKPDTPAIRGMVKAVAHLVCVLELDPEVERNP